MKERLRKMFYEKCSREKHLRDFVFSFQRRKKFINFQILGRNEMINTQFFTRHQVFRQALSSAGAIARILRQDSFVVRGR